jgi:hypothetical protein
MSKEFTMFFRKHHCRRCGVLVIRYCAPNDNMKIIQNVDIIALSDNVNYGINHQKIKIWK